VRLDRKALYDKSQENNGNQEQAVTRPAIRKARSFGQKVPVHLSSHQR